MCLGTKNIKTIKNIRDSIALLTHILSQLVYFAKPLASAGANSFGHGGQGRRRRWIRLCVTKDANDVRNEV